jgi:cobalt transporter subunit CbtA
MFRRIVMTALLAGAVAGFVVTAFQYWQVVPLIEAAERFEAAPVHDHAAAGAAPAAGRDHGQVAWQPADGLERAFFTLLANLLTAVGFGLVLSAAYAVRGGCDLHQGLLWGAGGFAAFALAPAFGLPPEIPGSIAADLFARQTWWLAAAGATAGGLALLVFGRSWLARAAALLLLVAPHAVGAPRPEAMGGNAPPELAAAFVVASLFASAVFWLVLGAASGYLFRRFAPTAA